MEPDVDRPAAKTCSLLVRILVDIHFEPVAGKLPDIDEKTARALGVPPATADGK